MDSMNTLWKWMVRGLLVLVVVLVVAISLTIGWRPFLGPRARVLTDRKFEVTPERLARGRYLANAVSGCIFCHSEHDWKAPGGPVIESKLGAGEVFPLMGLPGTVVAPNLTPEPDTFTNGSSELIVAPGARSGCGFRREVGSNSLEPFVKVSAMMEEHCFR